MVQSTHEICVAQERVVKRFRSWEQGEPRREWDGLTLLHRFAPGLAPEPLDRVTDQGPPAVVMSRITGRPLGDKALSRAEVRALGGALRRLYSAVPMEHLDAVPERRWGPSELVARVRPWAAQDHPRVGESVEAALAAARAWTETPTMIALARPPVERVFTNADGNLANFLWDGERCRIVDFEDSGASDPAYEVADLVEHVSVTLGGLVTVDELVAVLGLTAAQESRLLESRRLFAVFWLLMLLPGNPAHRRNPAGSLEKQAARVLHLLDDRPATTTPR